MIQSSQLLKLLHQKIVLKQHVIFTTQRVLHSIPLLSLSKTVTESLQMFIRGAKIDPWGSLSLSVLCLQML